MKGLVLLLLISGCAAGENYYGFDSEDIESILEQQLIESIGQIVHCQKDPLYLSDEPAHYLYTQVSPIDSESVTS